MIRRLLPTTALLLVLASTAQAESINLLLTMDHLWPTIGAPEITYVYRVFEAPSNGWPTQTDSVPQTVLASGSARILPGTTSHNLLLDTDSLDNVYMDIWGEYVTDPRLPFTLGRYVALPPEGPFPDWDALSFAYGPPWIPLADLGDGLSGDFRYFFGFSRGDIGTWEITAVADPVTPVPEPASLLLFGSGLAAMAAKRYRRRNSGVD